MPLGIFIAEFYPNLHPVFIACRNGDTKEVVRHLETGVHVDIQDQNHASLIATSIEGGYEDIVKILIDHGLNPNKALNRFGETPLMRAVTEKNQPIVDLLLKSGADVNMTDGRGYTPLLSASAGGDVSMIELLIREGADPGKQSDSGRDALTVAIVSEQIPAITWWISHGNDIEHRDSMGNTPLMIAAKFGKSASTMWLLEHGADIHAKDERGKTALDLAKADGHVKIVELLQLRMGS
ncbi:MAG: ankyrin repeat domain-containing protein [Verrucomicrobiota bacterium]